MPLVAKVALSAATARSHCATSWQPAAVAIPCTRAITGTGSLWMDSITRLHWANSCWYHARSGFAAMSLRLWPAQNARPSAASTTTRRLSSRAAASSACCSAASISLPSALKRAASFSVRVSTPRASRCTRRGTSERPAPEAASGETAEVMAQRKNRGRRSCAQVAEKAPQRRVQRSASTRTCASTLRESALIT